MIEVQHFMYLNPSESISTSISSIIEVQHFMYLNLLGGTMNFCFCN